MFLLSSADFFHFFSSQENLSVTLSECHTLDPDQERRSVGPDLGLNCLQRLQADDKCRR